MNPEPKKVLIICYSFPPHPGIGGRRWAKFAKYLSMQGFEVFAIGAENIFASESDWTADVKKPRIHTHQHRFSYQRILQNPLRFKQKLERRLVRFLTNIFTKYNPDLPTSYPNRRTWNQAEKLISVEEIHFVIVSGDPFLFYYASRLKVRKKFRLLLDYRDLWNDHTYYGSRVRFSRRQKSFFEYAENFAVNNASGLIFVDPNLREVIGRRLKNPEVRTVVIPNGYDPDDFSPVKKSNSGDVINVYFAGNVSSDLNQIMVNFIKTCQRAAKDSSSSQFRIRIYGNLDTQILEAIEPVDTGFLTIVPGKLDKQMYYERLYESDIGLVVLSDEYRHSFITKFSDYLFTNKFMLNIGYRGMFADYIEKHRVGIYINEADDQFFSKLAEAYKGRQLLSAPEKEKYSLQSLTRQLIKELE